MLVVSRLCFGLSMEMVRMMVRNHLRYLRRHGVCHLVLFLPLHATILEPDFDLSFTEAESVGYLDPPPSSQVAIEMELLFQL